MDLNSTTLAKAAAIIAPSLGLSMPEDRDEVVLAVNKYRNLLYDLYVDVKLFDDYKVCCCVQKVRQDCSGDECGDGWFYAITIPDDMAGVVMAWERNEPMVLHSKWRESHVGLSVSGGSELSLTQMPESSPTERDMDRASSLKLYAFDERDAGKIVTLKGTTYGGSKVEVRVKLEVDGFSHTKEVFCKIESVVLPDLCGLVELKAGDCTLSIYYPHEHVPRYRRYKIKGVCNSKSVLIQGTRRYVDLSSDSDIVEIGDRLIIEAAGRYFRYSEHSTDREDLARAEYDLNRMRQLVDGVVSRHRGRMQQDGSPVSRANRGNIRSGLQGYRNRGGRRW